MKLIKSKKAIVLLAMSIVAIVAAVGAYAYFTTTGSGSGTATVGTSSNLALVGSSASTLYPGGPSSDVTFTADNTSPGHQQLGTIYLASVQAYPTALDRTNGTNVISGCGSVDPGNAAAHRSLGHALSQLRRDAEARAAMEA